MPVVLYPQEGLCILVCHCCFDYACEVLMEMDEVWRRDGCQVLLIKFVVTLPLCFLFSSIFLYRVLDESSEIVR